MLISRARGFLDTGNTNPGSDSTAHGVRHVRLGARLAFRALFVCGTRFMGSFSP